VDTDVLCLKNDIPDTAYVFAKGDDAGQLYLSSILKMPPDSEFLSRATAFFSQTQRYIGVDRIGAEVVNELVRELGLEDHAWAPRELYPLPWYEALEVFDPSQADRIQALVASSTFVHFYTQMLGLSNVLKDIRPPVSSFLDRLYTQHDIDFVTDRRYEWAELEPQYQFQKLHWWLEGEAARLGAEVRELQQERERITIPLRERSAGQ